ncbi:hypothetical protein O2E79_11025, partial [Escherichia coli]|uniref:hypothetical protein n=1 Tax=Escherichia coli TaxID=562 RepID=UPI002FC5B029
KEKGGGEGEGGGEEREEGRGRKEGRGEEKGEEKKKKGEGESRKGQRAKGRYFREKYRINGNKFSNLKKVILPNMTIITI